MKSESRKPKPEDHVSVSLGFRASAFFRISVFAFRVLTSRPRLPERAPFASFIFSNGQGKFRPGKLPSTTRFLSKANRSLLAPALPK
jgi:hypothetical protein